MSRLIASIPLVLAGYPPININLTLQHGYYAAIRKVFHKRLGGSAYSLCALLGSRRGLCPLHPMSSRRDACYRGIHPGSHLKRFNRLHFIVNPTVKISLSRILVNWKMYSGLPFESRVNDLAQ